MNKPNKEDKPACLKEALKALEKGEIASYFEFMSYCLSNQTLLNALRNEYIKGKDDSNFADRLKAYADIVKTEIEQETGTKIVEENQQEKEYTKESEGAEFEIPTSNADTIQHPLIRVLLMGTATAGKSCFLMGLYEHLFTHGGGRLRLNLDEEDSMYHKGNKYIQKIWNDWHNKKILPPGGAGEEVYQTKWWYQPTLTHEEFDLEF